MSVSKYFRFAGGCCLLALMLWGVAGRVWAEPTKRVKLIVWGLQSGKDTAGLDAQVAEFTRRNPDIELSLLSVGAGSMNPQKLMTSIVGHVPPDVVAQDRFTIGDWASRDAFMSLDDFLAKETGADAVRRENYYPAAWNEAVYKGKSYAIPTGIDDRLLFYNRQIFREAGLDPDKPPRTWDELLEYSKKLTKYNADGTYQRIGFIPNYGNSWLYLYAWQNGGAFMSPDRTQCTLAAPENIGALDYMVKVYDALGGIDKINIFQSGFQTNEQDPFYLGKVAMVTNGSWALNGVARYAPGLDFSVAPAPVPAERLQGKGRFAGKAPYITWIGGYSFAIPAGARHASEAWRFIRFMSSVEGALIAAKADKKYNEAKGRPYVFNLSANKNVNAALLANFPPVNENLLKAQRAFVEMLPNAQYRPVTFVGQKLWDGHVRAFDRAVAHAQTPKAALEEQQKLVQQELDKRSPAKNCRCSISQFRG